MIFGCSYFGVSFCKKLMPSVIAQDPALEPAWVTEGTLPLWMRFGSFHVAGQAWAKYHYEHPWGSFAEWLERLEQKYDRDNAEAKLFWAEFSSNPEKQAKILADRTLHRETKRILDTDRPYTPARGLLEPKPEPVEEISDVGSFAYRLGGDIMSE